VVGLLGSDPGPIVVAALAGGPLHEPLELAGSVPTVVPALAAATLVLEVAREGASHRLL
jgi:hypothetical protein